MSCSTEENLVDISGDVVRSEPVPYPEADFSPTGDLVCNVLDDAVRYRLVGNISGHLLNGVSEAILEKAFSYWKHVDTDLGARIENVVREIQRHPSGFVDTRNKPS
ncbi:MAG: catalase-related domain-containing protein [Bowdeniella nasicola]|nr:catalase-related domain-containing protein [Bowdeniella nasicola]